MPTRVGKPPSIEATMRDPTERAPTASWVDLAVGLVPDAIRRARLAGRTRNEPAIADRPIQRPEFVAMVDRARTVHDGPLIVRSGALPADARFSYWAGACFRTADGRLDHLLDAYSCAVRATVDDGRGEVRVRPFGDALHAAEERAGRVLRKGLFTSLRGAPLGERVTHVYGRTAAHDCVLWNDTLVATTQVGHFFFDPVTLEPCAAGPFEAHGADGWGWANHPMIDPATDRLVTYRFRIGPAFTTDFEFVEVSRDGAVRRRTVAWPTLVGPHAFSATDRYYLLPDIAVDFALARFVLGTSRGILAEMEDDPSRGLVVHVVPRDPSAEAFSVRFELHGFAYHIVNGWDDGDRIVFDAYVSNLNPERESSQFELDAARPVWTNLGGLFRFTVDVARRTAEKRLLVPGLQRLTFHAIDEARRGRRYRHAWYVANDQHEGSSSVVGRFDAEAGTLVETFALGEGVFLRQPRVVARGTDEGDAWLVVPAYRYDETQFLLFDALDLAKGPVAVLGCAAVLPYAIHGWAQPTPPKR